MNSVVNRIEAITIGDAWIGIAAAILKEGVAGSWEGMPIVELSAPRSRSARRE
jgi:hypothetical protein